MSDLATFTDRVQDVLRDAYRTPGWTPEEAEQYMADYGARRQQFEELAKRLNQTIIRPRLAMVGSYFANAHAQKEEPPTCSSWWFAFCQRFPAVAHLEFAVEHDVRVEKLIIHTQTHIMPAFVRFNQQDNLRLPLDDVSDEQVAQWAEERLLEFLDTYLRIDGGAEAFAEEPVTDPVCGMQIHRSDATASELYYGHPYFFCCDGCRDEFRKDPGRYVEVKTA
jgi:YHS domain-containing protein